MFKNKRFIPIILAVALCLVALIVLTACNHRTLEVTFDNTHTVYEGDTLDSLMPYLTVTYTDSDGDTRIVVGYTIQGTLAKGECRLTIKYQGLTASVTITVHPVEIENNDDTYTYTIHFDYDNADSGITTQYIVVTYGEPVGELPTPARTGYTFEGWYYGETKITSETIWTWNDEEETGQRLVASWKLIVQDFDIWADSYDLEQGDSALLYTDPDRYESVVGYFVIQGEDCGYVEDNRFYALFQGQCVIVGKVDEVYSNEIVINITKGYSEEITLTLAINKTFIETNDYADLTYTVSPYDYYYDVKYKFVSGEQHVTRIGRSLRGESSGTVEVAVYVGKYISNTVSLQIVDPADDPYTNVVSSWFYNNYNPATSLEDAYWRTEHNLMSGAIDDQDQAPTLANNQLKSGNKYVRNSATYFVDNGNTYQVVDSRGNVVNKIYKFGAYVTLDDVAAYVYAFGNIPANYTSSNSTSSLRGSPWGKYLRLNHSYFSGNTSSYPYEPVLPQIYGLDGDLRYYEIDIGTTGTDCDPAYDSVIYNDGNKITRGAARIVYSRYYGNGDHIDDLEDRYVFYTYNHYNDFQEYLNYKGGWGEMFGNITGGGQISSRYDYNPTPYVEVVRQNLTK